MQSPEPKTYDEFTARTGYEPKDDDLERVNCEHVGQIGHLSCGWCSLCDRPRFECGHIYDEHRAASDWWSNQSPSRRARWLTVADGPLSAWKEMVRRKGRLPRTDGGET